MSDLSTKPAGEPTAGDWWALSQQDRDMIDSIEDPRNPYAPHEKAGCIAPILPILALLVLALLVAGCTCPPCFISTTIECSDGTEAIVTGSSTWSNYDQGDNWYDGLLGRPVICANGGEYEICGLEWFNAWMVKDLNQERNVIYAAGVTLCAPPAPTATPGG